MKDIMQKLAELEATAPKVTKKKMLNEDSTTPPINVSNKIASLKDMFEALSESIPAGAKPLPVLDPQNKQAGMGFVTSNNPAVQNMLKALDPKDVQIVQAPGQPGQAPAAGQPAPAGATGQPQMGQMQMKEKKLDELSPNLLSRASIEAGKRQSAAAGTVINSPLTDPFSFEIGNFPEFVRSTKSAKMFIDRGLLTPDTAVTVTPGGGERRIHTQAKKIPELKDLFGNERIGPSKFWGKKVDKFNAAAKKATYRDQAKAQTANMSPAQKRQYDAMIKSGELAEAQLDELSPELLGRAADKAFRQGLDLRGKAFDRGQKVKKEIGYGREELDVDPSTPLGKATKARFNQYDKFMAGGLKAEKRDQEREDLRQATADLSPAMKRKLGLGEGAKVDRMVKHIEKSEKKLGKSKGEAEDIAWATANKRGMLDNKNKKKVKEGDIPSSSGVDTKGAGLGAGRSATTLEGKESQVEVIDNAFNRENYKDLIGKKYPKSKAPAYARVKEVNEGKKPDFLDLDKDGNKKEPMKKAAADKKKKKVDESMNHRISAARLEGKSHGLRGHAHSGKRYEDLEEMKAYHEGYKEGLDECYGQGVYETAPAMPAATVPGMADAAMEEGKLGKAVAGAALAATLGAGGMMAKGAYDYHKKDPAVGMSKYDMDRMAGRDFTKEDEMEEGNAFTAALAKTPKGGKFAVGGKTFTDRTGYDAKVNEYAFESLDQQLNALLNESEEVTEGLSVSISKGQQNSPDSVTITAQDAEAEHLLAFVKNAGLGLFGDDNADTHSSAMSVQPSHGAPDEVGAGGIDIGVVDGHDGMMGLMQKLSGIQSVGADDYADEEGDEEQLYGNHQAADKKDCGCDGDCECSDYDQPSNEATCNECGTYEGVHEAGCSMGSGKEMVDEVESEDQMEFEVAEDNAPDSGEAESTADENAEASEDMALAKAGSKGGTYTVNEDGDEASEEGPESKEGEGDEGAETVSESFANLFRKLSFIAEESTEKEDDKAEKAGKKVAKDIEHDEGHTGKDDDKAEKAGKKVTKDIEYDDKKDKKEKVDEWANNAGPGKTVSDTTFEQDIDFMTKVIAGGLNKPKSTGQTTIPVIAGQDDRMHDNPMDWATLAGIKK